MPSPPLITYTLRQLVFLLSLGATVQRKLACITAAAATAVSVRQQRVHLRSVNSQQQ
jgi:hypothetical protein